MLVYVHVEVLNLTLVRFDGVDEHRFEDVAWPAPIILVEQYLTTI